MIHHLHPSLDPRLAVDWTAPDHTLRPQGDESRRNAPADQGRPTAILDAAGLGGADNPAGDPAPIDTLRRAVADRRQASVGGVLIDWWSASVTVLIWDQLRDNQRDYLLRLPAHALILRCVQTYTRVAARRGKR
jgi:hypothetical protein